MYVMSYIGGGLLLRYAEGATYLAVVNVSVKNAQFNLLPKLHTPLLYWWRQKGIGMYRLLKIQLATYSREYCMVTIPTSRNIDTNNIFVVNAHHSQIQK